MEAVMPATTYQSVASTRQLAELSAVMRAIALARPNSAPALRLMADHYEMDAAAAEIATLRR